MFETLGSHLLPAWDAPVRLGFAATAPAEAAPTALGPFTASAMVTENGSALIDVLGPDPGAGLTLTAAGPASDGMTAVQGGKVLYAPFPGFIGRDTFIFDVRDAAGETGIGVAAIDVAAGGAPPTTAPVSATAAQGVRTAIDVLAADTGSGLLLTSVSAPSHGTAALVDGKIDYTSSAGYLGADAFTYMLKDADGVPATGSVSVAVLPVLPPTAVDQMATAAEGGSVLIDALAGDAGTGLSLTSVGAPADGTAAIQGGQVLYTPAPGFVGLDSFAYAVTGATGLTASASVDVAVQAAPAGASAGPTNVQPTVFSPALTVAENAGPTPVGIAAPTDPAADASALTIVIGAPPADGTVTLAGGGAVASGQTIGASDLAGLLFTPAPGVFAARSSLTYTVTDPLGNAASGAAELAIGPAVRAPFVSQPSLTVAAGAGPTGVGIAAPSDPNFASSELSIVVQALPSDGTLTDGAAPVATGQVLAADELAALRFTPGAAAGASAFGYRVSDPAGNAATATVALTVAAPPPVALPPPDASGVVHANLSSLDLAGLLHGGAALDLPAGTQAVRLADGTLSYGPDTSAAFVQRLYEGLLGRGADPRGLERWTDALARGQTPAQVAAGTLGSSEYAAAFAGADARAFVTSLYQGFLGRAPEPAGLADWLASAQTLGRAQVAALFAEAPEAKAHAAAETAGLFARDPAGTAVEELYGTALGREADPAGLARWTSVVGAQGAGAAAAGILAAKEAVAAHAGQTDAAFLADLFRNALGRPATAAELAGPAAELSAGASRANVLLQVATGAGAQAHLTSEDLLPPPPGQPAPPGPPSLAASGPAAAMQGAATSVTLASPAASSWTVIWGDGSAPQTVRGAAVSPTHVYALPGTYAVGAVANTPAGSFAAAPVSVAVSADTFQATAVAGLTTGFHVRFDAALNFATATAAADLATGAGPSVIVTDPAGARVPGSVAPDADGAGLTFTATVGALPNGTYRAVLLGGIRDSAGRLLDGNGDGTPGDDFQASFVVSPSDPAPA